jgi:N-acetylglucosamine kinase-like BadF-type ATPase
MDYFLGFDIGATKSHALLADKTGQVRGFANTGPGNHEVVGWPGLEDALQSLTHDVLNQARLSPDQISAAGFGLAGYDWPSQREPHIRAIETLGLACPIELVNDAVLGIIAGTSGGWGLAVISGTGENCWGIDRERRIGHMTGNSRLMGEYGGAGTIVERAIRDVAKAWGKRGPETALINAFIAAAGATDLDDLLEGLILERYWLDASHVRIVFDIAGGGDPVAIEAIRWAGEELGDLILGVSRQLNLIDTDYEIVMVGNTFKGGELLIEPMKQAVLAESPGATFLKLNVPPVTGGVLLGMELVDSPWLKVRQRLFQEIVTILEK